MKLVIVHYHLRPGGVTGVIRQQVVALKALMPELSITLLIGEKSDDFDQLPCEQVEIPELNYYHPQSRKEALDCESILFRAFSDEMTEMDTIFHFHNPTLGKNPSLTGAIHTLADKRSKIISTVHDFSEDRPINHMVNELYARWCESDVSEFLYPDRSNITYLTINQSDRQRDLWKSIKKSPVEVMSPPVQQVAPVESTRGEVACWLTLDSDKEWMFYPVRAIERKNIGEFILLAILDEGKREWLQARKPSNPTEIPHYNRWVSLCDELNINVHFDVVEKASFSDLMHASDRIITTSMREGFGMAYLEPWYIKKPVAGRELSMVVDDMREAGVWQDLLYQELLIPINHEWRDFGSLKSEQKLAVVKLISQNSEVRETIRIRNRWWDQMWTTPSAEVFEGNFNVIESTFSAQAFAKRLKAVYTK